MKFHLSHRLWFALARLPFRHRERPLPFLPPGPVCGQAALAHIAAGCRTLDYMGCELIAAYNAMFFLGRPRPLEEIIETYEGRRWLLLGGRWGADPYALGRYAAESGLAPAVFAGKKAFAAFEQAVRRGEGRVYVLSYWLGDTVFSGAHAVTLVHREGKLLVFNLHNGQTAPLPVEELSEILTPERLIVGYLFA